MARPADPLPRIVIGLAQAGTDGEDLSRALRPGQIALPAFRHGHRLTRRFAP